MRQVLLRAVVLLAAWAIGLVVAAWVVPGVAVSVPGFVVAVVVFSIAQAVLSCWVLRLPRAYASLLLGASGLALTVIALIVAAAATGGLAIDDFASFVAATVVVWLVTTVGAVMLPELFARDDVGSS
ncbi:hypothetical protein A5707_01865 [Mycobacterium kyorinense]|uniref:4 TMS phage holin, superfamily IV n=1 Tax=Mycobacterium kyorinense TaxID=487514 RepID=A0A1A2Z4C2_9MYCO|nr:hypothetical protein A5707_01865 [Mycobacterium kyorinense]